MSGPWALYWMAWVGAIGWPLALLFVRRVALKRGEWTRRAQWMSGALTAVWALGVYAFLIEPQMLVVRHVTVDSAMWRGPPLRIGLISDTHVGAPHVDARRIARVVRRMNVERPDIVFLLGDYAGSHNHARVRPAGDARQVIAGIAALARLDAPLGTIAVFGNHDWWFDGFVIERRIAAAGVTMLENDAVRVARAGGEFWVAGLSDVTSYRQQPDFPHALRKAPDDADVIAITHRPDIFAAAPRRLAVTVAGHSHCGQINLPVFGRLIAASRGSQRWPCGYYEDGGRQIYVTGGIGISILPARFNQPPEIVVLTLQRGSHARGAARRLARGERDEDSVPSARRR